MSTETQAVGVDVLGTSLSGFVTAAGVANFLGIPFARCDRRFCAAEKVPLTSLGTSVDATKWGPRCPQSVNHGRDRRGHLYEGHTAPAEMREAEAECLNLNVFQPQGAVGSETKLPVMVWIHGGGWVFGDGGPDYGENPSASGIDKSDAFKMATVSLQRRLVWVNRSFSSQSTIDLATMAFSALVSLKPRRLLRVAPMFLTSGFMISVSRWSG